MLSAKDVMLSLKKRGKRLNLKDSRSLDASKKRQ
jgi:hypothetical protein